MRRLRSVLMFLLVGMAGMAVGAYANFNFSTPGTWLLVPAEEVGIYYTLPDGQLKLVAQITRYGTLRRHSITEMEELGFQTEQNDLIRVDP